MSDTGVYHAQSLQGWQREAVLKAAQLIRDRFGNPPTDEQARQVHDGLLEVLDPDRRALRLQRELTDVTRQAVMVPRHERRAKERRQRERRKVNLGPPPGTDERRVADRRTGKDRRKLGLD
jgi:hypothetical protein